MNIQSFDTFEQMQAAVRSGLDFGARSIHPDQLTVTYGSHWVQFAYEAGVVIFGRVSTLEELRASSEAAGSTPEEAEYEEQSIKDSHAEHMLFGVAYSVIEPEGKYGSTHRMNLWPISKELFEAARSAGFDHRGLDAEHVLHLAQIEVFARQWAMVISEREALRSREGS